MNPTVLLFIFALLLFVPAAYSSQGFYPIMPWDSVHGWDEPAGGHVNGLESMAECGFTVSAFALPEDLPLIEKLGMKAMIHPPQGWREDLWRKPADEVDATVKKWVEPTAGNPVVLGYFVADEPGTSRFPALANVVDSIRKHAPGKIAYINLFPGYAIIGAHDQSQLGAESFTDYLEQYVSTVKPFLLSYDDYQVIWSDDLQDRELGAIYFRDLVEVRRVAEKHGLPFWNTICSNRIRPDSAVPSPANLLLQANTSLAAGAAGICWYTYYSHGYENAPIDSRGNRSDTWAYLQLVNRQVKVLGPIVKELKTTGVYFSDPAPASDLPKLPGRVIKSVATRTSLKGYSDDRPPVMVGEFEGGGSDYVLFVNLSLRKSANLLVTTNREYAKKEVVSNQDASFSPLDEKTGHWLVPGQCVLVKLTK